MPIQLTPRPKGLTGLDYVVCQRVADLPIPWQPAKIIACCKCSERIWRADKSPTTAPAICIQCVTALPGPDDNVTVVVGKNTAHNILRGKVTPLLDRLLDLAMKPKGKT